MHTTSPPSLLYTPVLALCTSTWRQNKVQVHVSGSVADALALMCLQEQDSIVAELTAAAKRLQARLAEARREAAAAAVAAAAEPEERRRLGAELAELHGRLGAAQVVQCSTPVTQSSYLSPWAPSQQCHRPCRKPSCFCTRPQCTYGQAPQR